MSFKNNKIYIYINRYNIYIYFTFNSECSVNILFITIQTQNKAHLNIFKFQLVEASTDNRVLSYIYTSHFHFN